MVRFSVVLLAIASSLHSFAAEYPQRPIRVIVPNGPGSAGDIVARIVFVRMVDILGQQLVVDNRPGAGGVIGMEIAARAIPDGYTLMTVTMGSNAIAPHVYKKFPLDPVGDFSSVGRFIAAQTGVVVHASVPARSIQELIELSRQKKGQLNMASAGMGSTSHLGGLLFNSLAKIDSVHVPYKGGGPSMASVAQGESHWTLGPLAAATVHIKAGRTRLLGTGGSKRSVLFPDVPTIAESGVAGFEFSGWNGLVAQKGTPAAAIARLNAAMVKSLALLEVRDAYLAQGEEPAPSTAEEFARIMRTDYEKMGRLVKQAGIQPQ